jgi:hypothetical protein
MEPEMVLSTARSGSVPSGWNVWPMRRDRVKRSIWGWAATTVVAFAMLIPVIIVTVPHNFENGDFGFFVSGLLLAILAAVAFGGLCITLYDIWRLRHANEYLLVMTPTDLVRADPKKIVHVPMDKIGYITLRGVKTQQYRPATSVSLDDMAREQSSALRSISAGAALNRMVGNANFRRRPPEAPSLAFVDLRDDSEVVIATDNTFDELIALNEVLWSHVEKAERTSRT